LNVSKIVKFYSHRVVLMYSPSQDFEFDLTATPETEENEVEIESESPAGNILQFAQSNDGFENWYTDNCTMGIDKGFVSALYNYSIGLGRR
jgi:hypothetical protein